MRLRFMRQFNHNINVESISNQKLIINTKLMVVFIINTKNQTTKEEVYFQIHSLFHQLLQKS